MTRRLDIDDLYDMALPEQPAISPDGSAIAYVLRTTDREKDRDTRALWLVPTVEGAARQLTRGNSDTAPAWSPDGTRIAFLRAENGSAGHGSAGNGGAQLYVLPAAGGEAEQITMLPLGAGAPVWSPDGARIAFSAPVDLRATDGEDDATRTKRSVAPVVADRLGYKADGTGLLRTIRQHLHVLTLADLTTRRVTHGDWHAGGPAWSPDGTQLGFAAALDADADLTFRTGAYVIEADKRTAQPRLVGLGQGQVDAVTWTTDGTALLVVGRADTQPGNAGLVRIPLNSDAIANLAESLDRNVMLGAPGLPGALPQQSGHDVLFCVRDHGYTHLYAVPVEGGTPRLIVDSGNVCGSSTAEGLAAIVLGTTSSYGEIAAVDLATGELHIRTTHGAARTDIDLYALEEREFTISDGTVVQGWLLRDAGRSGPLPLLLDIHGGPHMAWSGAGDALRPYHQVLAATGWAVLLVNPRGSDGYGEAFYTAAVGAWGLADARDFLEPLDQLVAEGVADPDRLAVAGYSYGGYMTCHLTSHDTRFAAAVAGGLVSDLASMIGASDYGQYLATVELGSMPWADREHFARMSPLTQVQAVRTPTLIVHGAEDVRCPVGQAELWFAALRTQGVPAQLVLYPGGSHLFVLNGRPSHRADWNHRTVDWLEQHVNNRPIRDASPPDRSHAVPRQAPLIPVIS